MILVHIHGDALVLLFDKPVQQLVLHCCFDIPYLFGDSAGEVKDRDSAEHQEGDRVLTLLRPVLPIRDHIENFHDLGRYFCTALLHRSLGMSFDLCLFINGKVCEFQRMLFCVSVHSQAIQVAVQTLLRSQ